MVILITQAVSFFLIWAMERSLYQVGLRTKISIAQIPKSNLKWWIKLSVLCNGSQIIKDSVFL